MIRSVARRVALSIIAGVNRFIAHRAAKRGLNAPIQRTQFIDRLAGQHVLEIGPFDNPLIVGEHVRYFDVLDADGLRARAIAHGRRPERVPRIHYSSPTGDLSVVDRKFDAVISSHVIEHQPDLVAHMNAVANLLAKGGRYYIIAPDKRFCFDFFLPLSTFGDVANAHRTGRLVHTRDAVLAHRLGTTHNNARLHWIGVHGRPRPDAAVHSEAEAQANAADRGEYVDVHAWIFSPSRFRDVITELSNENMIGLRLAEIHETAFGALEYFAVLERRE